MRRTLFFRTVAAAAVLLSAGGTQAQSVFVGSVADWIANPSQLSGDKTFIYVSSSGGWSGDELVTISSNIPQNSETVSIDGLSDYIAPQELMLAYEVVISSSDVFGTISLDQNFSDGQRRCRTRWTMESRSPSGPPGPGLTVDSESELLVWKPCPSDRRRDRDRVSGQGR